MKYLEFVGDSVPNYEGSVTDGGSYYTVQIDAPRFYEKSVTVSVEPVSTKYKTMAYKGTVQGITLHEKQPYYQEFILYAQRVDMSGTLQLGYAGNLLSIKIPLVNHVPVNNFILTTGLV